MRKPKKAKPVKKGRRIFTFTDSMIVIAVLAVAYVLATIYIIGLQNEARMSKIKGDLKSLQMAVESYKNNHDICPKEEDYERVLSSEFPNILPGHLNDPYGATASAPYSYSTSYNQLHYIAFSVGKNRNGSATIRDDGKIFVRGTPIIISSGYL